MQIKNIRIGEKNGLNLNDHPTIPYNDITAIHDIYDVKLSVLSGKVTYCNLRDGRTFQIRFQSDIYKAREIKGNIVGGYEESHVAKYQELLKTFVDDLQFAYGIKFPNTITPKSLYESSADAEVTFGDINYVLKKTGRSIDFAIRSIKLLAQSKREIEEINYNSRRESLKKNNSEFF